MRVRLKHLVLVLSLAMPLAAAAADPPADSGENAFRSLPWQKGPASGNVSGKAALKMDQGAAMLDQKSSGKFLEMTGNLPSDDYNVLATDRWWAVFSFSPVGYVKDDEKIDPDQLLKDIKESDGPANAERRKRGLSELYTDGWFIPPHYDAQSKRLEWALKLRDGKDVTINYTVRLLGRTGYESATLVSSPEQLDQDVQSFKTALQGFEFNAGEKYAEFRQGDRVAEFGLAALVAGGAAAAAVKTGFWKVLLGGLAAFWKVIAAAVVAVGVGIAKLFKRDSSAR